MKIVNLYISRDKEKTSEEIIAGCLKGDANCQEALFRLYAPLIMTVCRRYEHQDFGASDILQETFILVFKNLSRYDANKGSLKGWIKKIAVNTALKVARQRKISFLDIETQVTQLETPVAEPSEVVRYPEEEVLAAIQELPHGYRTIFNLFIVENYSHKEIADLLEISVATSKSQLHKAKKLLRKKLTVKEETTNIGTGKLKFY